MWGVATKLPIWLGPNNPCIRFALQRACRPAVLSFTRQYVDIRRDHRIIRIAAKHFPYARDLAHYFDSYFSQVVPERIGSDLLVDYSGPKLQTYPDGLQFEISAMPEETEALESYFYWYQPKPTDTIFDIGAYCGVSTYHFAKAVPEGKVVAFEPDPINYELLVRNIKRHHLRNAIPVRSAMAGESGSAAFSSEGTMGSQLKRQSSRATLGKIETIQTLSLESACREYGMPAFAKVDIEGSEIEMLAGSQPFLREHPIQFALDTNHWMRGMAKTRELTAATVEKLFRECGYETHSSAESGYMATRARPTVSAQLISQTEPRPDFPPREEIDTTGRAKGQGAGH